MHPREFKPTAIPRPDLPAEVARRLAQGGFDIEIGAGQGLHAVRYCQANPDRTLLAVERTHTRFARLNNRRLRHPELKGLLPLQSDAMSVIAHYVTNGQLQRVFLLYPNPNPKRKQANLRWHNSPFMGHLHAKMHTGAELHLATNFKWYAEEAKAIMTSVWGFELAMEVELHGDNVEPRTHFEKKYLARGETCYDFVFRKQLGL